MSSTRSHHLCWTGESYVHTCHVPSGRTCVDCDQPAGTGWGPLWCPDCDVIRLDRCSAGFADIQAEFEQMGKTRKTTTSEGET